MNAKDLVRQEERRPNPSTQNSQECAMRAISRTECRLENGQGKLDMTTFRRSVQSSVKVEI